MGTSTPESGTLDPQIFRAVCAYAVAHLIPPDDVMRQFAGIPSREPFLLSPDYIWGRTDLSRFLRILAQLYKHGRERFEEAAPTIRGTRRAYFGRTRDEVYSTGSSNLAEKIPEAPWYVSSNNSGSRKATIVYDLMCRMQFSITYSHMISSLCFKTEAMLPWEYDKALRQIAEDPPPV